MRESELERDLPPAVASFRACLATILELDTSEIPLTADEPDPATGWSLSRWLGGLGLGLIPVANPAEFSWAGPWLGLISTGDGGQRRTVVMYGVPSGVAYDPTEATAAPGWELVEGYVIAGLDVALARPQPAGAPAGTGTVEAILVAATAGAPVAALDRAEAIPGWGLEGDRHVTGAGTFPSGKPGSALTLIEAEVCESFAPPLTHGEHRRNIVTRGIGLNGLVGHDFEIGPIRCHGMRLCEPCAVLQRYADRPVLRPLVHRGGLRADILTAGAIAVGDPIVVARS